MSTSLILLTLALLLFRIAITPPQPPAHESEKILKPGDRKRKADALRNLVAAIREVFSVILLSEIAANCCSQYVFIKNTCPPPFNDVSPRLSTTLLCGLLFIIVGGLIRAACYRALGQAFTWEVTRPPSLVTTGPYAWARHPSYPGIWVTMVGSILFLISPGTFFREYVVHGGGFVVIALIAFYTIWATTWCTFLLSRANQEDILMKTQFGEEWEVWNRRTRAKFVPFIW